jgi:thiol-disulfide isomerase/thioredoxin
VKTILATVFILSAFVAHSQKDSLPYQRFPDVPPFQLLATDSLNTVTRNDLKPGLPVLIMYFSPECDHCQKQTEFILSAIDSLRNVEIVLATYQPFTQLKVFVKKYNLSAYPNIYIGRDTRYFMAPFYNIHKLPFLALYNSKGKLITTYATGAIGETLVKSFKE